MSDVPVDHLLSVDEAIRIIDACLVNVRRESVDLPDADGRVLLEDVRADRDYPPFDKSLMDGYAVRSADANGVGIVLNSVGEIAAGESMTSTLQTGQCVAIMTGAPLPPGSDAVVPIERVTVTGDRVRLNHPVTAGQSVSPRGSEALAGQMILMVGQRLGAAQLAACAQVGAAHVTVAVKPQIGVLSSGNEVVPFDRTPIGAQIRNSNSILLQNLIHAYGADAVDLGHVADDPQQIENALITPGLDVIVVTGGMSMGAYDYTPKVMRKLGYDLPVTKLKIRPGKPFVMAVKTTAASVASPFLFGLPGNPVSAFVCTVRLVSRILLRMQGLSPEPNWRTGRLDHDLPANGPREFYQPAIANAQTIQPLVFTSSADLFTLARANCLIRRTENEPAVPRGGVVHTLPVPGC